MIGGNLLSKKMKKKDIIKIENKELTKEETDSIALVSPSATIIIIKNYKVVKKNKVEVPQKINKHIICPNQNCITNIENVKTKFLLVDKEPIKLKCNYCEKQYEIEYIKFNI